MAWSHFNKCTRTSTLFILCRHHSKRRTCSSVILPVSLSHCAGRLFVFIMQRFPAFIKLSSSVSHERRLSSTSSQHIKSQGGNACKRGHARPEHMFCFRAIKRICVAQKRTNRRPPIVPAPHRSVPGNLRLRLRAVSITAALQTDGQRPGHQLHRHFLVVSTHVFGGPIKMKLVMVSQTVATLAFSRQRSATSSNDHGPTHARKKWFSPFLGGLGSDLVAMVVVRCLRNWCDVSSPA